MDWGRRLAEGIDGQIKKGKLPVSHRYNRLHLLSSDPGGIQQELVVQDLPAAKIRFSCLSRHFFHFFCPASLFRVYFCFR